MKIYLEVRVDCPTPQRAQEICNEIEAAIDSWVDEQEKDRAEYATCDVLRTED